jgi:hypothetical protein
MNPVTQPAIDALAAAGILILVSIAFVVCILVGVDNG